MISPHICEFIYACAVLNMNISTCMNCLGYSTSCMLNRKLHHTVAEFPEDHRKMKSEEIYLI